MKATLYLAVVSLLCVAATEIAYAYRCPNGSLVLQGDSAFEVIENCGQPDHKQFLGYLKINRQKITVDRYVYVPPAGEFVRIVELHNAVVVNISLGRRVE